MPTGSLRNADDLTFLLGRLERLHPDAKAAWGTLDAPRMVCHLGDSLRVALGELSARPPHSWLSRSLGRFVVVHTGFEAPPAVCIRPSDRSLRTSGASSAGST